MIFRYYFLKEGSRVYDKSELITYLQAQPYVKFLDDGVIKKAIYHNTVLNFEATFVFNNKSIINRIEKLDPKYLDLNLYVEFNLLNNTFKVNRLIDIIQEICQRFNFAVYNEFFEDVSPFDRSLMINVFNVCKNAYKKKSEDDSYNEFTNYSKLSRDSFDQIYSFLEVKESLESSSDYKALDYVFLRERETRNAYVAINLTNLNEGCIIPPGVKLVQYVQDGERIVISYDELLKKISKFLTNISSNGNYNILLLQDKYVKKVKKVLTKSKFARAVVELNEVALDNILDL